MILSLNCYHILSIYVYDFAGVSHGDDTGYILGVNYMNPHETEPDKKMSKQLINMWVSFAKTG